MSSACEDASIPSFSPLKPTTVSGNSVVVENPAGSEMLLTVKSAEPQLKITKFCVSAVFVFPKVMGSVRSVGSYHLLDGLVLRKWKMASLVTVRSKVSVSNFVPSVNSNTTFVPSYVVVSSTTGVNDAAKLVELVALAVRALDAISTSHHRYTSRCSYRQPRWSAE